MESPPDIVLLDIGLPGMTGYEVAQRLRQHRATRHIRIIVLSGYGRPDDVRRALAAGFDAHLVKPARIEQIQTAIDG